MFSNYRQTVTIQGQGQNEIVKDRQPEYYALLKFIVSPHLMIKSAYHYLYTAYSTTNSHANLGFLGLSANFSRFNFEADLSVLNTGQYIVKQSGIQAGVAFSGNLNIYLNSALSMTNQQNINQFIYNQKAGIKLFKKVWLEGNLTFGDLTNYNDYDAMYVYNTIDPIIFRAGPTLFINVGKHITIWTNYCYERKELNENTLYHYNQYSYLGGVKWKL